MKSVSFLLTILALSSCFIASGQYTETINNNRPGGSQGAFSVGTNVLQFETGFGIGQEDHVLLKTQTDAFSLDYSARFGFWKEELEVILTGEFQSNTITDTRSGATNVYDQRNFRSNTLGIKYLVYDPYIKRELNGPNLLSWKANNRFSWDELIPAISIYAGANFDSANNAFTPEDPFTISPKVSIQTQNNFKSGFVLVTNIIADRFTTQTPTYGYIVTLTYCISDWFSLFAEKQGFDSDFYADNIVRFGAAALITKDWQVDASLLYSLKDTPSRTYGRIGVSYRFDFHDSDEFLEEKGKAGREIKKVEKEKAKREKRKKKDYFEVDDDNDGL
ncbi:transporter [Flavobacteriaceae bacterium]|nr:transporter [Flavobacteriaceae bacterium]